MDTRKFVEITIPESDDIDINAISGKWVFKLELPHLVEDVAKSSYESKLNDLDGVEFSFDSSSKLAAKYKVEFGELSDVYTGEVTRLFFHRFAALSNMLLMERPINATLFADMNRKQYEYLATSYYFHKLVVEAQKKKSKLRDEIKRLNDIVDGIDGDGGESYKEEVPSLTSTES